jgi:SAM-dependent methyltransferase
MSTMIAFVRMWSESDLGLVEHGPYMQGAPVDSPDRERLRRTFTEDAELYDRARPGYPPALFRDLADRTGIGPGSRVLEIGCGTGQATVALAERGYRVVAVELGREMAEVARRNLARFPGVEVVTAAFEDWPLPEEPFDVVLSATAFHWIDPEVRVGRSADALRPGGTLATIATHHAAGGTGRFFVDAQDCYLCFDPATPPGLRLSDPSAIPSDAEEIDRSPRFHAPEFHRYEWDLTYSTEEYIDVLTTYSNHRALPAAARIGLLTCISTLIDTHYDGRITKHHLTELRLARRSR